MASTKFLSNLVIDGSGGTVLDVQGSVGQLFSITDSLTGDLFAVSDISGIPILNVNSSGAVDIDGTLNLGDSNKIQLGASQDLQIFHNGSNSYIETSSTSTGDFFVTARGTNHDLYLEAADNIYIRPQGNENGVVVVGNGGVTLYYNNVAKLETYATGAGVTGSFYLASGNYVHFDNGVTNNYAIRKNSTNLEFKTGGGYNFLSGNATFAGDVTVAGGDLTLGTDSIASNINAVGDVLGINVDSNTGGGEGANIQLKTAGTTQLTINSSTSTFAGNVDIYTGAGLATLNIGRNASEKLQIDQTDNETVLTANNDSDGDGDHNFRLNRVFAGSGANNFKIQKGGTDQLTIDKDANATFAGAVTTGGKLYIGTTSATTTATTALLLGAAGEVKKRALGSNAFSSTSFAPLASPALTGTPTAPTAGATVNTTQLATTAFVQTAVSNLVDSSPDALNTLNELAAALGNDASFSTTVTNSIATKLPLAGGTMTGALTITHTGDGLTLQSATDGTTSAGITFTSQGTSASQKGHVRYNHRDSLSYGSAESFTIGGTEATTTILADGKLMYAEGIYSKPSSGTGGGTRRDANWNTAYTYSQVGHLPLAGGTMTGGLTGTTATFSGQAHFKDSGNSSGGSILMGPSGSGVNKWSYLAGTHYNQDTGSGNGSGSAGVAVIGCLSTSTYNKVLIGGNPYEINPATQIEFWTHTSTTHTLGGSVKMKIAGDGAITFSTYGAGILKTNASGVVSLDTNTYSTATGVEDNADVTDATNVAAAGALMRAGGTMSGTLALDNADSLSFESGKHWITYNDGEGNFNIRVGHKSDSSTNEVSTETGYVFHDEWSQTSGWREFNVSGTSITEGGDVGTWRRQMFYDYNDVRLSYQGGLRLQTTSAGVTVSGNIAATNFSGSSSGTNTGDQDLSGYITGLDWAEITGDAADINVSSFNNDAGYITGVATYNGGTGDGLVPGHTIPTSIDQDYFLNGAGSWSIPPNDNTTYSAGAGLTLTGTTFSVTANTYATAAQGTTADAALPKAGGTMTGNVILNDSVELRLGSSSDFKGYHNGTNTHLRNYTGQFVIENYSDDKDILFKSDDGSGGATDYIVIDGSTTENVFYKNAALRDSVKATFGNSNDLQIYHDGSNSYINDAGTGDLYIRANNLRLQNADGSGQTINTNNGGNVELFHNNSKKFETTSTGVSVTGNLVASNDITATGDLSVRNINASGDINVNTNSLIKYEENTDVDTGTETVATVAHATYTAAFFDYVIKNGTNVRAGTVYSCHDGTNVEFTETSTVDLGDTSDVTLAVDISGTDMRLRATTTSNDWSVKSLVRAI